MITIVIALLETYAKYEAKDLYVGAFVLDAFGIAVTSIILYEMIV